MPADGEAHSSRLGQRFENFSLACVLGRVLLLRTPNSVVGQAQSIRDELAVPCFCAACRRHAIGGNPQTGFRRSSVQSCSPWTPPQAPSARTAAASSFRSRNAERPCAAMRRGVVSYDSKQMWILPTSMRSSKNPSWALESETIRSIADQTECYAVYCGSNAWPSAPVWLHERSRRVQCLGSINLLAARDYPQPGRCIGLDLCRQRDGDGA